MVEETKKGLPSWVFWLGVVLFGCGGVYLSDVYQSSPELQKQGSAIEKGIDTVDSLADKFDKSGKVSGAIDKFNAATDTILDSTPIIEEVTK